MIKIENMKSETGNGVANQFVITDNINNTVTFQSYKSTIAIYSKEDRTLTLYDSWNCSTTTLKYFKQFINDYTCLSYKTKKDFENVVSLKGEEYFSKIKFEY